MNKINNLGVLYIVSTPIGNLQDISFRALDVLKTVDCIIAEDTRHSQPLLQHFSIDTRLESLHEYNEKEKSTSIIKRMQEGRSFALISDAGTPLISDPGYSVVLAAQKAHLKVVPIPGACAAIAALSASGLATDRFTFEGFLPAKKISRIAKLTSLLTENRTMIFYEAPHRIVDFFEDIVEVFGPERHVSFGRELTKMFETIKTGATSEVLEFIRADANQQKGEMVITLAGAEIEADTDVTLATLKILLEELSLKQAVDITAKLTKVKKNKVYQMALALK